MTQKIEDRRTYKRYGKDIEFSLKVDAGTYKCKTMDYSAEGLCLQFIDGKPPLYRGKTTEIKIEDPEIDALCEVLWSKETDHGLIAGFRRLGNIKGTCYDFRLPDILIGLQRKGKTGIFEVLTGAMRTRVFLKNGDMIFANSDQEDDRFGEVLIREGKITLDQYFEAGEKLKATGKRLGKVLVELGYLKPNELIGAVRHQVVEIIINLLTVECGFFEFREGPLPSEETITLNLSAANIIYQGIKRVRNFHYIINDLPPLDTVLTLSQDPLDLFQDVSLNDADKEIFSRIRGDTTIREVLSHSSLSDFETIKTIYALLCARVVEIKREDSPPPAVSPEEVISSPLVEMDEEFVKAVEHMYETCKTRGYYEILGVKAWSSEREIKKAYFSMAKEFHPDRHFSLASGDIKRKLNEVFAYITEAYNTLSDIGKREEYDREHAAVRAYLHGTEPNTGTADARFDEGRTKMALGFHDDAERLFAQAINLDGSQPHYHYYHGLALSRMNAFKEAVRAFENAIKLNPRKAHYYAELGHALLKLGFKKRAESNLKKALEISPSNEKAVAGMGMLDG